MVLVPSARRAAQYALRLLMQHISQEAWASLWRRDLEFLLWAAISPPRRDPPWPLSREQTASLAWLAQEAGGWYHWSPDDVAVSFVDVTAWKPLYETWLTQRSAQSGEMGNHLPF